MIALLAVLLAQALPPGLLTLEAAERLAQQHQPQLRAAHGSTQAAEGRVEQFRSPLLPQLSATGGYLHTTNNFIFRPGVLSRTGATTTFDTINYYNSSVSLTQLLWDFEQTTDRWRSTQASARASAQQERVTGNLIIYQVRVAFFNAVAFKDLLEVARETLANQRNHRTQIQGFVQAGTRPPIDLSQAQADFSNAEVVVINADNNYKRSKVLLNQAMGLGGPIDYEIADEWLPPQSDEDSPLSPLLEIALKARPEIAFATEQIKAQQLLIQSARGAYGPTIFANAGFQQGNATGTNYTGWNVNAGVTFTWNLFQGGLTNGFIHEAEGNLVFAAAQLDVQRLQIRVDVDNALLAIRAAKTALASAKNAARAARQRLALAEGRYQNGSGSVIELGDAQVQAANFNAQVVTTEFQLATARAQLEWAVGRW
jgi:outer membrane protein